MYMYIVPGRRRYNWSQYNRMHIRESYRVQSSFRESSKPLIDPRHSATRSLIAVDCDYRPNWERQAAPAGCARMCSMHASRASAPRRKRMTLTNTRHCLLHANQSPKRWSLMLWSEIWINDSYKKKKKKNNEGKLTEKFLTGTCNDGIWILYIENTNEQI